MTPAEGGRRASWPDGGEYWRGRRVAVAGGAGKGTADRTMTTSRDETRNRYTCNDVRGVGTRVEISASTVQSLT